jgi:hypothetical protein
LGYILLPSKKILPSIFFQTFACVAAVMSFSSVLLGQFKKEILFKVLLIGLLIETILLAFNLVI